MISEDYIVRQMASFIREQVCILNLSLPFLSNHRQAVGGVVVPFIVDALLHKYGQKATFLSLVSHAVTREYSGFRVLVVH